MMIFRDDTDSGLRSDYYISLRRLGSPTGVQNINQIGEMTLRLNEGMKNVEIGTVQPELFEQIPKQHFEEMRRVGKLVGARPSVHAPIIDPAGFTQQGWSEEQRRENERRIMHTIDMAYQLEPQGGIPVTLHASGGVPAYQWEKGFISDEERERAKREGREPRETPKAIIAIDQEAKKLLPLEYEKKHYVEREEEYTPERRLAEINRTQWDNEKLKIMSYQAEKERVLARKRMAEQGLDLLREGAKRNVLNEEQEKLLEEKERQLKVTDGHIIELDTHIRSGLQDMHHRYKKFGVLKEEEEVREEAIYDELEKLKRRFEEEMQLRLRVGEIAKRKGKDEARDFFKSNKSKMVTSEEMLGVLSGLPTPKQIVPVEEFARKKTVETISNVALKAYKNYGDKAPIISMENFLPDLAMGRAENLKKAVIDTRKEFQDKLMKEQKVPEEQARKIAEKMIGVTWDVGHISFLKKSGYTDEDIIEEAKKISPYVKHLHLTDNFGYSDSHLPPGMGTVPIKEQIEIIEKKLRAEGVKEQDLPRAIIEAGAFAAGFKTSPQPYAMEELGVPFSRVDRALTWADVRETVGAYGQYMMGYGDILPEQHFQSLYGAGFSNLPRELGGQIGGDKSRFAGTPNQ